MLRQFLLPSSVRGTDGQHLQRQPLTAVEFNRLRVLTDTSNAVLGHFRFSRALYKRYEESAKKEGGETRPVHISQSSHLSSSSSSSAAAPPEEGRLPLWWSERYREVEKRAAVINTGRADRSPKRQTAPAPPPKPSRVEMLMFYYQAGPSRNTQADLQGSQQRDFTSYAPVAKQSGDGAETDYNNKSQAQQGEKQREGASRTWDFMRQNKMKMLSWHLP